MSPDPSVVESLGLTFDDPFVFHLGGEEITQQELINKYFQFYSEHPDLVILNKSAIRA